MKDAKDLFSSQSDNYRQFRPQYPPQLIEEIVSMCKNLDCAWDCATGNGQVAAVLADHFKSVRASDISGPQLENALKRSNIEYEQVRAENTEYQEDSFDLITVAQALHWFDFDAFFKEVHRVGKSDGIIAVWGYGLLRFDPEIDGLIDSFYNETVGDYWEEERKYIEDHYTSIPFPFAEMELQKPYFISKDFTIESLAGYLGTWSSVKKFIQSNGYDPIPRFIKRLSLVWGDPGKHRSAIFPVFTRIGRIPN